MGYQEEKREIDGKKKRATVITLIVIAVLVVALCVFAAFVPPNTWAYYVALPEIQARKDGELKITFLDVGQGDCTLVELPDGKTLLIDGGNGGADATKSILRYLNASKIDKIDYLVLTHADVDHCGGLERIMQMKEIGAAYLPITAPEKDSAYASFYQAVQENGCEWDFGARGVSIASTDERYPFTLQFLNPLSQDVEQEELDPNEASAMIWLDYYGVSALFTGDAPTQAENRLMEHYELGLLDNSKVDLTSTEILKVSHHGGEDSTSLGFLNFLGAETATISCGEGNAYGHPAPSLLARLKVAGLDVYRTDLQGHICLTISPDGTYRVSVLGG